MSEKPILFSGPMVRDEDEAVELCVQAQGTTWAVVRMLAIIVRILLRIEARLVMKDEQQP